MAKYVQIKELATKMSFQSTYGWDFRGGAGADGGEIFLSFSD
jgi:hypothetical protein